MGQKNFIIPETTKMSKKFQIIENKFHKQTWLSKKCSNQINQSTFTQKKKLVQKYGLLIGF